MSPHSRPPGLPQRLRAMIKRLFDLALGAVALIVASPLLLFAAIGIWLSDRRPIFYRARLTGRDGRPFTMYKLRTMRVHDGRASSIITADRDPRVFRFGAWLRRSKVDELPQLLNILRGDMSIVGPRPQHPDIVARYYTPEHRELLRVRPGLTSPGALYDYQYGEAIIGPTDPERAYVERLLPTVLALDLAYMRRDSLRGDAALVARTIRLIAGTLSGRHAPRHPPELDDARRLRTTRPVTTSQPS